MGTDSEPEFEEEVIKIEAESVLQRAAKLFG